MIRLTVLKKARERKLRQALAVARYHYEIAADVNRHAALLAFMAAMKEFSDYVIVR